MINSELHNSVWRFCGILFGVFVYTPRHSHLGENKYAKCAFFSLDRNSKAIQVLK